MEPSLNTRLTIPRQSERSTPCGINGSSTASGMRSSTKEEPRKNQTGTILMPRTIPGFGPNGAEFCRREDVSPASFYQWRRKLVSETSRGGAVRRICKLQEEKDPAGATSESRIVRETRQAPHARSRATLDNIGLSGRQLANLAFAQSLADLFRRVPV